VTQRLGMFPLSTVLFPGGELPLHIFEPRYLALTADCLGQDREFGVVMISRGSETGGGDERVDTGTVARIDRGSQLPDNRLFLEARGLRRVRVHEWLPDDPYPQAMVEEVADIPFGDNSRSLASAESSVRRLRSLLSEMGDIPALPHDLDLGDSVLHRSLDFHRIAHTGQPPQPPNVTFTSLAARYTFPSERTAAITRQVSAILTRVTIEGSVPSGSWNVEDRMVGFFSTRIAIRSTRGKPVETLIGTTAPFSAISGASSSTAVDSAAPPSPAALSASPTLFASKAALANSAPIADGWSSPSAASTPTRPTPPPARSAARRSPSVGKSLNLGSNGRISFILFWQARPLSQIL